MINLFYLHGLSLQVPDLNAGDLLRLTLTRVVETVRRAVGAAPDRGAYSVQTGGVPILIYNSRRDDVIDYRQSLRFSEGRDNAQVKLDAIWAGYKDLVGLA